MPKFLVKVHPRYGTPWVSILFCALVYSIFSLSAFAALVVIDVFLNMLVLMAEFFAMWKLRFSMPELERKKVPGGWFGLTLVTLAPALDHWTCDLQPVCRGRHGIHFMGVGRHGDWRGAVFPNPHVGQARGSRCRSVCSRARRRNRGDQRFRTGQVSVRKDAEQREAEFCRNTRPGLSISERSGCFKSSAPV